MKILFLTASLALAACDPMSGIATDSAPMADTMSETSTVLPEIMGKTLSNDAGYVMIMSDGSLTGEFNGKALTGSWTEEDGYFCRKVQLDGEALPDDCQTLTRVEGGIMLGREKGQGSTALYKVSG